MLKLIDIDMLIARGVSIAEIRDYLDWLENQDDEENENGNG